MSDRAALRVCVKHRFSAPAEGVFDAWLAPAQASKFFFATTAGRIVRAEIDARVGGGFTIVDRRDGEDAVHTGTFLELDRPRRIVFRFQVDKYASEQTLVTIEIAPLPDGCELTITQDIDAKYADFIERAHDGWANMLELAGQALAEAPASHDAKE